jgi:hypothetical protein
LSRINALFNRHCGYDAALIKLLKMPKYIFYKRAPIYHILLF